MILSYEVVVDVVEEVAAAFETYMREKHIPEILETGCFVGASFERAAPTRFRTSYRGSQAGLDRYLAEHAAGFREDFMKHFPSGAVPSRNVWAPVQAWHEG